MVFGADIIAGFPTETEGMFRNSLDLVEECGLTHLHVFPFSARPGTPAARMPQEIGATRRVLTESHGTGRTEQFIQVKLAGPFEAWANSRSDDGRSRRQTTAGGLIRLLRESEAAAWAATNTS
jgi:hypothetical protein